MTIRTVIVDHWDIEIEPMETPEGQEYWWPKRVMYSLDLRMMNFFVRLPDDIEKWEDVASDELGWEKDIEE